MNANEKVTVLFDRDGKPEYVVLRWDDYERMRSADVASASADFDAEDEADVAAAETAARYRAGEEMRIGALSENLEALIAIGIPHEVLRRELDGVKPLRAWRDFRGLSQAQLSTQAGISRAYLAQIETGERTGTVEVMAKLARCLGCLIEDLIADAEPRN